MTAVGALPPPHKPQTLQCINLGGLEPLPTVSLQGRNSHWETALADLLWSPETLQESEPPPACTLRALRQIYLYDCLFFQ